MGKLSCIIPVVGTTAGLESTLLSVLENRPDDCEVLVVLNTRYDDPYALAGEIRFIAAPAAAGLVSCVNLGIAAAGGEVVHLLSPGVQVTPCWAERAIAHFADPMVAAVTPVVYDSVHPERPLSAGVGYQRGGRRTVCQLPPAPRSTGRAGGTPGGSVLESVGPTFRAAFYRKTAIDATGLGFVHDLGDELADIDLALMLRAAGWKLVIEPECQVYAGGTVEQRIGGFRAGLHGERLFWRHARELGLLKSIVAHLPAVAAELFSEKSWSRAPAQLAGRLAALCQLGQLRKYRQALALCRMEAAVARAESQNQAGAPQPDDPQRRLDAPHWAARKPSAGSPAARAQTTSR